VLVAVALTALLECGRAARHERSYRFRRPAGVRIPQAPRRSTAHGTRGPLISRTPQDARKRQLRVPHSKKSAAPMGRFISRQAGGLHYGGEHPAMGRLRSRRRGGDYLDPSCETLGMPGRRPCRAGRDQAPGRTRAVFCPPKDHNHQDPKGCTPEQLLSNLKALGLAAAAPPAEGAEESLCHRSNPATQAVQ
jgi:hypothetical protein